MTTKFNSGHVELISPFPELLWAERGHGWRIETAPGLQGWCQPEAKVMCVPRGTSYQALRVRIHEMGHAFLTRGEPNKLASRACCQVDTYQAVEDCRVHLWLSHVAKIDLSPPIFDERMVQELVVAALARHVLRQVCLMTVAAAHTGDYDTMRLALQRGALRDGTVAARIEQIAEKAIAMLSQEERPNQKRTGEVAGWLEKQLMRLEWRHPRETPSQRISKTDTMVRESVNEVKDWLLKLGMHPNLVHIRRPEDAPDQTPIPATFEPRQSPFERLVRAVQSAGGLSKGDGSRTTTLAVRASGIGSSPAFVPWGSMRIEEARLMQSLPGHLKPGRRMATEGLRLGRVERMITDGRMFYRRIKRAGGTVLIDVSSSMSLSAEQISRIVEAAPGALVGIYSGRHESGVLRIVARNGLIAAASELKRDMGGANVIDAPALEWLAQQEGPLFWVSDGGVSGIGDQSSPENQRLVQKLCERANITRLPTVKEAVRRLESLSGRAPGHLEPSANRTPIFVSD